MAARSIAKMIATKGLRGTLAGSKNSCKNGWGVNEYLDRKWLRKRLRSECTSGQKMAAKHGGEIKPKN